MRQRLFQQRRVLETVADALLEFSRIASPPLRFFGWLLGRADRFGRAGRVAFRLWRRRRELFCHLDALAFWRSAHWRAAHRMIEKSRLRRSAVGQRQICQAAAPSPIEK